MSTTWWDIPTALTQIDAQLVAISARQTQMTAQLTGLQTLVTRMLTSMQTKENKMADVMDTVLVNVQQLATDLATEGGGINQIVALLQQVQSGGISASDPRFQDAINKLQNLDNTIKTQTAAIAAALPTPPSP